MPKAQLHATLTRGKEITRNLLSIGRTGEPHYRYTALGDGGAVVPAYSKENQ